MSPRMEIAASIRRIALSVTVTIPLMTDVTESAWADGVPARTRANPSVDNAILMGICAWIFGLGSHPIDTRPPDGYAGQNTRSNRQ